MSLHGPDLMAPCSPLAVASCGSLPSVAMPKSTFIVPVLSPLATASPQVSIGATAIDNIPIERSTSPKLSPSLNPIAHAWSPSQQPPPPTSVAAPQLYVAQVVCRASHSKAGDVPSFPTPPPGASSYASPDGSPALLFSSTSVEAFVKPPIIYQVLTVFGFKPSCPVDFSQIHTNWVGDHGLAHSRLSSRPDVAPSRHSMHRSHSTSYSRDLD